MIDVLVDTHVYAWMVTQPSKLSATARATLADPTTTPFVSSATVWEMAIKQRGGKWPEVRTLLRQHDEVMDRLGARELPIAASHARRAGGLDWSHADPVDRMLAAQSLLSGLPLVTRDKVFGELGGLQIIW